MLCRVLWQRSHAERDARQLCEEGGDAARRREARGADRLLLRDRLGGVDRAAGDRRHLHQQLAARTVDRQPADAGEYPLVARLRVILIAGVGALIWGWAFLRRHDDTPLVAADKDPLTLAALTPSQRSLGKYLFVVLALFIFPVFIGGFPE